MAISDKLQQVLPQKVKVKASPFRLVAAFVLAAGSDAVSVFVEFVPPVQIAVDLVTGLVLWGLLGWRWYLLPALVIEAIPGLAAFPMWILVVGAYTVWPQKLAIPQDNQQSQA